MTCCIDVTEIKQAARGREAEILEHIGGIPSELLDGKHHACPKCGGKDRFRFDTAELFALCNQCFDHSNGDFLAAVRWMRGWDFPTTVKEVSGYLGLGASGNCKRSRIDRIELLAKVKRCRVESLRRYGAQAEGPYVTFPMYGPDGQRCSTFTIDPTSNGKPGKGLNKKGEPAGLFLPHDVGDKPRVPKAGETWIGVEGPKDASALDGLGYNGFGLPGRQLARKFARLFEGVNVVLVPDLDQPSMQGMTTSAARLKGISASVKMARLPGEVKASHGDDVRDVLARQNGEQSVRQAIADAQSWQPDAGDSAHESCPCVVLGFNEIEIADNVIDELATFGWRQGNEETHRTYQRSGKLVHVVKSPPTELCGVRLPDGTLRIRPLPRSVLRERISASVSFLDTTDEKGGRKRPPEWLVRAISERGQYPAKLRSLLGIVRSPTLRPDGTILQEPGYDILTGLLYEPDGRYPIIPASPSREVAYQAAQELLHLVNDFPFAAEDHRSVWLSTLLTLMGRHAINGPTPLIAFDANTPGTGKSLLVDVAGMIAYGTDLARKSWPGDNDEVRKTITAVALESLPAVLWDNVAGTLGCPSLDAALTAVTWQDRLLGKNETTGTIPLTTIWLATGNNLVIGADTARRTLYCRIESLQENPEDRTEFEHPNLLAWVRDHRHHLAAAAVTILRAYVAAGKPDQRLTAWGSYEAWSALIRGAVVWLGLPDPCRTRVIVRNADRSVELLRLLLDGIDEACTGEGVTTSDIVRLLDRPVSDNKPDPYPILRAAVAEACGKPNAQKLGYRLRQLTGRVCGGRRLVNRPGHGGVKVWAVEYLRGGDGGDGGDVSPPLARRKVSEIRNREQPEISPPSPPSPPEDVAESCNGGLTHDWQDDLESDGKTRRFCTRCCKFAGFVQPDGSVVGGA